MNDLKECSPLSTARLYTTCLNFICLHLDQVCELKQVVKTEEVTAFPSSINKNIPVLFDSANQLSYDQHQKLLANLKQQQHQQQTKNELSSARYNEQACQMLVFKDKSTKCNYTVSEDLLERMCDLGKLNDTTLALFTSNQTLLKKFHVKNATLSKSMLKQILKQHQIDELILNNIDTAAENINSNSTSNNKIYHHHSTCFNLTINDLIDSLSPWSLEHLKHLNVARNTTLFSSILVNMKQLRNLQRLNVSFTSFSNQSLETISHDLNQLDFLDLSGTRVNDLTPLLRLQDKLKYLYMYNMRSSLSDDIMSTVCCLRSLKHLDVSCDLSTKIFADISLSVFDVNVLLDELAIASLLDFVYLDVSGKSNVKQESLIRFLRSYPELKFLGLALTNANSFDYFVKEYYSSNKNVAALRLSSSTPFLSGLVGDNDNYKNDRVAKNELLLKLHQQSFNRNFYQNKNDMIVTGESTEPQLVASLRYYKTRHFYIQKSLCHLYMQTKNAHESRPDLLQLIDELMHIHNKSQSVQLAATTCIYNLTRQSLYARVSPSLLTQIINTIIATMLSYPNTISLQKNCLFILCNEKILNNCIFNKCDCIRAGLECLNMYNDANIVNSSIAIVAKVALNSENKHRRIFKKIVCNSLKYVSKLIGIIEQRTDNLTNDSILYSVLGIFMVLSEENAEWCCHFVTQNGLNVYSKLINVFENNFDILAKSLSLIYNLSETEQIKPVLFAHPITKLVGNLVDIGDLKVSFPAVGFYINLLCFRSSPGKKISAVEIDSQLRLKLEAKIDSWSNQELSSNAQFKRHSTHNLVKMSRNSSEPLAQMWSIWAIYITTLLTNANENESANLCSLVSLIRSIILDKLTSYKVRKLFSLVLILVQNTTILRKHTR